MDRCYFPVYSPAQALWNARCLILVGGRLGFICTCWWKLSLSEQGAAHSTSLRKALLLTVCFMCASMGLMPQIWGSEGWRGIISSPLEVVLREGPVCAVRNSLDHWFYVLHWICCMDTSNEVTCETFLTAFEWGVAGSCNGVVVFSLFVISECVCSVIFGWVVLPASSQRDLYFVVCHLSLLHTPMLLIEH